MFDSLVAPPEEVPLSRCWPSGWLALELDSAMAVPGGLDDGDLVEAMIAFDRVVSWAAARQARVLAEFARRRPCRDDPVAARTNAPSVASEFAPDEVGLALRLSRVAAGARLEQAVTLQRVLPEVLTAWEQGVLDAAKVRAIVEACRPLSAAHAQAVAARTLPRAGEQTVGALRAALARAVIALDPEGAAERHRQARRERRVVLGAEPEGMASLWALLPAPDAVAAHQHLGVLARALGAGDPRGMDARRADLMADLLTGRRCALTHPASPGRCAEDSSNPRADSDPAPARVRPPSVHVTVPITMLMGLDEQPGELRGYGPIPAALAREIAAGGTWTRLLTDPASGTLLDYGRTTYTPPVGLADHVRARDVRCRSPICRRSAADADLDHTVDGTITYITPTGHRYTSRPHDYRPDPPPDPDPPPEHGPSPGHEADPPPF